MDDLNFEELDKAMSQMRSAAQPGDKPGQQPEAPPNQITEPVINTLQVVQPGGSTAATPVATTRTALPARRPSRLPSRTTGQQKTISDIIRPTQPVARRSPDIRPLTPEINLIPTPQPATAKTVEPPVAELVQTEDPVLEVSDQPEIQTPASKPEPNIEPETRSDSPWPDPIDFAREKDGLSDTATEDTKNETDWLIPSPFLPDAKVEKRPLGAPPATPEPNTAPQSSTAPSGLGYEPTEPNIAPADTLPATTKVNDSPVMPLPRTYKTSALKDNRPPRPLYDTEQYHPPLLEAVNPGSSSKQLRVWLLVILGVVLIGVLMYLSYGLMGWNFVR